MFERVGAKKLKRGWRCLCVPTVCERLELGVRASLQPVPEHAVAEEDFSGLFESVRPSLHPRCFLKGFFCSHSGHDRDATVVSLFFLQVQDWACGTDWPGH
jgi:hypothetical protein